MNVADIVPIARRSFLARLAGAVVLAALAAIEVPKVFPGLFARSYPPTPFDDLLVLLPDRENAVRLGAVLTGNRRPDPNRLAVQLRNKLRRGSLAGAITVDLAQNRLTEAQGWLVPESLAELCALAASVEPS